MDPCDGGVRSTSHPSKADRLLQPLQQTSSPHSESRDLPHRRMHPRPRRAEHHGRRSHRSGRRPRASRSVRRAGLRKNDVEVAASVGPGVVRPDPASRSRSTEARQDLPFGSAEQRRRWRSGSSGPGTPARACQSIQQLCRQRRNTADPAPTMRSSPRDLLRTHRHIIGKFAH